MSVPSCCNCSNLGAVLVDDPGVNPLVYCMDHLPKHLLPQLAAGHYKPPPDSAPEEPDE